MKRPDELNLTFHLEDLPGCVQDAVADFDIRTLTVPPAAGHAFELETVNAVVTSVIHYFPTEEGDSIEMAVMADVTRRPWTEDGLIGALSGISILSNPRIESAFTLHDSLGCGMCYELMGER